MRNFYHMLGVDINATPNQITAAYRALEIKAKLDLAERNKNYYAFLYEAYTTLLNPSKRDKHRQDLLEEAKDHYFILATASETLPCAAEVSSLSQDKFLEYLQQNSSHAVPAWLDANYHDLLDEWGWIELAKHHIQLAETIAGSSYLENWSNYNIVQLATIFPAYCKIILANAPVASLLTGFDLIKINPDSNSDINLLIVSDRALNLKYTAAQIIIQHQRILKLPEKETIIVNENYVLAKMLTYNNTKDSIQKAIRYYTLAVAQLHLLSFYELVKLGKKADLIACLNHCEKLDKNSVDYPTLKAWIIKHLTYIIATELTPTHSRLQFNKPGTPRSDSNRENSQAMVWGNLQHFDILKIHPTQSLDAIKAAYLQIQAEAELDTLDRNKTYYAKVETAYRELTASPMNGVTIPQQKIKANLDSLLVSRLRQAPELAMNIWKRNRCRLYQWQWLEILQLNHDLAVEICTSKTLTGWCNFIIFKLASLSEECCATLLHNRDAANLLTATEICRLADMYPGVRDIIKNDSSLFDKYYAKQLIESGKFYLPQEETALVINANYILGKVYLQENNLIAASYFFKKGILEGHVRSFYELIQMTKEGENEVLTFCQEKCNEKFRPNTDAYKGIKYEINQKYPVSIAGVKTVRSLCSDLQIYAASNPNILFPNKTEKQRSGSVSTNEDVYDHSELRVSQNRGFGLRRYSTPPL
jgi:hypothetical protein